MIELPLETWVSLGGLLAVAIGLYTPIRAGLGRVERELARTRTELKGDIDNLRTELKGDIDNLRTELKGDIDNLRTELKGDIDNLRTELGGDIDRLDDRVYALAAGLRPTLEHTRDTGPAA